MTCQGWVKLHRCGLDHPVLRVPNNFAAFFRLIARAQARPKLVSYRDRGVALERGQVAFSVREFAAFCGLSYQSFRTSLNALRDAAMITVEANATPNATPNARLTVVTICNYDLYQASADEANATPNATANAQNKKELNKKDTLNPVKPVSLTRIQGPSDDGHDAAAHDAAEPLVAPEVEARVAERGERLPVSPARALLWAEMKKYLGGPRAGGLIGRWCRDYGEAQVFAAYFAAVRVQPADPVSWMTKRLAKAAGVSPVGDEGLSFVDRVLKSIAAAEARDAAAGEAVDGGDHADGIEGGDHGPGWGAAVIDGTATGPH